MSKFDDYYKARDILLNILEKDLLGPVEVDETLSEFPLTYYAMGKLYPQDCHESVIETHGENVVDNAADGYDESLNLSRQVQPSSMGLTVFPNITNAAYKIEIEYAYYKKSEVADDQKPKWARTSCSHSRTWRVADGEFVERYPEGLTLRMILRPHPQMNEGRVATISLVNTNHDTDDIEERNSRSFFQPKIRILAEEQGAAFKPFENDATRSGDDEIVELALLYRQSKTYGQGHGCSVTWNSDHPSPNFIETEFFPRFDLKQMKPSGPENQALFNMKRLSEISADTFKNEMVDFIGLYSSWIKGLESELEHLPQNLSDAAKRNIDRCKESCVRMQKSCDLITEDKESFLAFQYANKAMYLQRRQELTNKGKSVKDDEINWYPFQLAFLLHEASSFINPGGPEREVADLLWFPTGGGKTEAYLGVAAFAIFLRRIRHPGKQGVAVLMRYTLRLLTSQQFERASSLIMACDLVRRQEQISPLPITIGLWVGDSLTPNNIERMKAALECCANGTISSSKYPDPIQVKRCPWCGETLSHCDYSISGGKLKIKCPNNECEFNAPSTGLPIYLVDEDIFRDLPTYIVATVDKFAQIPLKAETGRFFESSTSNLPPELIIQDELHLISGPLGSMVGLYETALLKLCENNGVRPKIVAATATIRNAKSQIKSLFCENYVQFPPQGLSIEDSFFAVSSSRSERPSRQYAGVMGVGMTATTALIRINAALLFGTRYLKSRGYSDVVVDSFWTIVGYFNSLRELGGASTQTMDDVQNRFSFLAGSKFKNSYPGVDGKVPYCKIHELTSRNNGISIADSIGLLECSLTGQNPNDVLDYVLSTNMISVGVDVSRLGIMAVAGQPKTSSEYIQATSRVGRSTPGLVVTLYNPSRARDRSHYEQFTKYHASLYRYVESTSLTPFSDRARDRGLQAVFVGLCRHLIPSLKENESANLYQDSMDGVQEIKDYILDYVQRVDPDEVESVREELDDISDQWEQRTGNDLKYVDGYYRQKPRSLFKSDLSDDRFRAMNSLRSVESQSAVYIRK